MGEDRGQKWQQGQAALGPNNGLADVSRLCMHGALPHVGCVSEWEAGEWNSGWVLPVHLRGDLSAKVHQFAHRILVLSLPRWDRQWGSLRPM